MRTLFALWILATLWGLFCWIIYLPCAASQKKSAARYSDTNRLSWVGILGLLSTPFWAGITLIWLGIMPLVGALFVGTFALNLYVHYRLAPIASDWLHALYFSAGYFTLCSLLPFALIFKFGGVSTGPPSYSMMTHSEATLWGSILLVLWTGPLAGPIITATWRRITSSLRMVTPYEVPPEK